MHEQAIQQPARHGWRTALLLLVIAAGVVIAALPHTSHASTPPTLINGSFEGGFVNQPVCRWRSDLYETNVGAGWRCFTNFGAARYGFYADAWPPVVADGQTSQLIEINTWGLESGDNDRYAGIYQTVPTSPGADYQFSMRGMIRTTKLDGDAWRYSVQVGYLEGGDTDWRNVKNWTDVGWNTYYPRTEPGVFNEYQTVLTPESDQITLFIRVWKKWGLTNEEIDVNLDAISLMRDEG
jgi:hypothetical protein